MANQFFTRRINELSKEEGDQLLQILYRMVERPEYQVRMRWKDAGDLCVYDNRNTNHYAVSDYGEMLETGALRRIHHTALLGEPTKNADGVVIGDDPGLKDA